MGIRSMVLALPCCLLAAAAARGDAPWWGEAWQYRLVVRVPPADLRAGLDTAQFSMEEQADLCAETGRDLRVLDERGREAAHQSLVPAQGEPQAGELLVRFRLADDAVYARLTAASDALSAAVGAALDQAGVPHVVQRAGTLFSVFFGAEVAAGVHDDAVAQRQDSAAYRRFFHAMLDAGVSLPPSAFEAWFVTAAHDDDVIARIADALPAAARAAAG